MPDVYGGREHCIIEINFKDEAFTEGKYVRLEKSLYLDEIVMRRLLSCIQGFSYSKTHSMYMSESKLKRTLVVPSRYDDIKHIANNDIIRHAATLWN